MRGMPTSQWRRPVIVFGCAALVVLLAFAEPATAQGKPRGRDRVPSELWKTYPLEPSEEGARIRSSPESDRPQVSPTSSGRVPAGRDDGQPTAVGDDSSAPRALSVFLLSLVGLIVVVLVARPAAAVGRRVRSSMTRTAAAVVSPLRSVATVPRSKLAGSSFRPASPRSRTPSRRGPSTRPRLIPGFSDDSRNVRSRTASWRASRRFAFRAGAAAGAGLARTAGKVLHFPMRVATAMGATFRSASVGILSKRGEILFYTLALVTSAALGIGVTLLLTGD